MRENDMIPCKWQQIITPKTIALAKEKGFYKDVKIDDCLTITQSVLQKWLREKYNIHINVIYGLTFTFQIRGTIPCIIDYEEDEKYWGHSYEKTLEIGLQEALKIIIHKKENNMIQVGDKITYHDDHQIIIVNSKQCKLANGEMNIIIKVERPKFSEVKIG